MAQEFDNAYVESVLNFLDENNHLFPQFALTKLNNHLKLLGTGGFSSVYEMYNKERPELLFALKVTGFQLHMVDTEEFRNTRGIQWILCQESKYIMRILDSRELCLVVNDNGNITRVLDITKESCTECKNTLFLEFCLMEKLEVLITKDRFNNVNLLREELSTEKGVFKFAFEIGQGLATAHMNKFLHRDIKLENVFWDEKELVYKIGDFGVAKWAEDGYAETVLYTKGYGAPEIETRLYDNYNSTADIYSLGITLYLLLNDLKFPGSEGYYPKVQIQYNPEFVFPAPIHASEGMARVIRKMCSYYPDDRYQSMNEVLVELSDILTDEEMDIADDLFELAEMDTETFREEKEDVKEILEHPKTRAQRKEEEQMLISWYRWESGIYCFFMTLLLIFLFKGLQPNSSMVTNWLFCMLPIALLVDTLLQRIQEFHFIFGAVTLMATVISIYFIGLSVPHLIIIVCVILDIPMITLVGSMGTGLWIVLEISQKFAFLDYISKWDLGWMILTVILLVTYRYFYMRIAYGMTTYTRAIIGIRIYNILYYVMTLVGILLFLLQKYNFIIIPDIIGRVHFIRTGLVSTCVMLFYYNYWDKKSVSN